MCDDGGLVRVVDDSEQLDLAVAGLQRSALVDELAKCGDAGARVELAGFVRVAGDADALLSPIDSARRAESFFKYFSGRMGDESVGQMGRNLKCQKFLPKMGKCLPK